MMERYYNLEDTDKAAIAAGITTAAGVATALAQRPRRELSEIEKRCGKKGRRNKKAQEQWEKCASEQSSQNVNQNNTNPTQQKENWFKKNQKIIFISSSIIAVAIIGFVVYKRMKK